MITEIVICDKCGDKFDIDSNEFYTIEGNIYINISCGLVGNNLDSEGKVVNTTHLCKTCLNAILFYI